MELETILTYGRYILDILVVSFILYKIMNWIRGTRMVPLLKGLSVIFGLWLFSEWLELEVLKFLVSQVLLYGLLGVIIIFQPELRQALENLGRRKVFTREFEEDGFSEEMVADIVKSVEYMSKRRIGALISIELGESLEDYAKTGISLDAKLSKELIENIFSPNMPLHDGAMIIKSGRVVSASCYLPLSERPDIPKELGTRHRAAIGLSEISDALILVVSEETGDVSLAKNNKLYRKLSLDELKNHLEMVLIHSEEDKKRLRFDLFRLKK